MKLFKITTVINNPAQGLCAGVAMVQGIACIQAITDAYNGIPADMRPHVDSITCTKVADLKSEESRIVQLPGRG